MTEADTHARFNREMRGIYDSAKRELGYNATLFLRMLSENGGIETARRLVSAANMSDGYAYLWSHHRLDLTVEALVVRDEFIELFDDEVLDAARMRLDQCGYVQRGN